MSSVTDAAIAIFAIAMVVGFFFGLMWLGARITGWTSLARTRATEKAPEGQRKLGSLRVGSFGNYNAIMVFHFGAAGLWLRPIWPFRIGHPRLLLPWGELRVTGEEGLLAKWVVLEIDGRSLAMPKGLWEENAPKDGGGDGRARRGGRDAYGLG